MNDKISPFPEALSDEAATQLLDLLYALTSEFENHYANQLRRYAQQIDRSQPDLFESNGDEPGFDDELTF